MSSRSRPEAASGGSAVAIEPIWLAVGAVAVVLLVAAALAPSWPFPDWVRAPLAGAAGLAVAGVLWRAFVQGRRHAQTLARFSAALRDGDVAAALRAVKVALPGADASSRFSASFLVSEPTRPSQFERAAREVELALGERERRWQARMRLSADWHWETDDQLRLVWVSRDLGLPTKLGMQPEEVLGRRVDEVPAFQPPEGGWRPLLDRMTQHRSLREVVLEVRRRGRSPVWVALNARAYFDEAGRFIGYEGVGRDVTEQRLAHLRLAESERRHAMIAELAADWYWRTDARHALVELGPTAVETLGEGASTALGHTRWEAAAEGATDAEWAAHRDDLAARRSFRGFEYAARVPGRGLRWVAISGVPQFDDKGDFLGYHGVGRDITLKKRAERLLLTRNEHLERLVAERTAELEQSNRDLEAFSRQLAHELRTPIGQVVGLADLLRSRAWDRLAEDEREWLRLAGQAAREMSHTVTALLELARSTSAALLLEPVDLSTLAESVVADLPWLERRAPIEWVIEPGLTAHCSATLARVVLVNLLGNAAKFTRDVQTPRVEFVRDAQGGEGALLVRDNGAGFEPGRAATLFQPFVRLHRHEQFQGTGLGLSIVRRIVERHGGAVSAEGAPGRGAMFRFRLGPPRAAMMAAPADAADSQRDVAA
ncbi:MAG TPA: ATP-binding protein [Burkholderiaceae bacterium]|nr:ATP-binding protein [Burkholderiaceae bacterium]